MFGGPEIKTLFKNRYLKCRKAMGEKGVLEIISGNYTKLPF